MKSKKLQLQKRSGFTLIELLIVIALLGALAVGLLATVDPFEQLKKGTDTSTRNTASEVYNSMIRYYSVKQAFPWGLSTLTAEALSSGTMTGTPGYLVSVMSAGELKSEFIQLAGAGNLGKIYLTSTALGGKVENVTVCYQPESKAFRNDQNYQYNSVGTVTAGCSGLSTCYWCIK